MCHINLLENAQESLVAFQQGGCPNGPAEIVPLINLVLIILSRIRCLTRVLFLVFVTHTPFNRSVPASLLNTPTSTLSPSSSLKSRCFHSVHI